MTPDRVQKVALHWTAQIRQRFGMKEIQGKHIKATWYYFLKKMSDPQLKLVLLTSFRKLVF